MIGTFDDVSSGKNISFNIGKADGRGIFLRILLETLDKNKPSLPIEIHM
jgi:hypothetical protein